jgi:hypothetical protein
VTKDQSIIAGVAKDGFHLLVLFFERTPPEQLLKNQAEDRGLAG